MSATEWHRDAQETTLESAREALATVEAGGVAFRGQDDDGLWYVSAGLEMPSSLTYAAQVILDSEFPEGAPVLDQRDFADEGDWADAAADSDIACRKQVAEVLAAAGLAAEVFLHDQRPGQIRVMEAGLI